MRREQLIAKLETRIATETAFIAGADFVLRNKLVYGDVPGLTERRARLARLKNSLAKLQTPIDER